MRRIIVCMETAALITLSVVISAGCGGGNRVIDNKAGVVETAALDLAELPQAAERGEYKIGYGDVIDVLFLYNTDYSREKIMVRPDGRISYPYIGDIEVVGRTAASLDSLLTERFREIINEPDIAVILREFEKQMVYILGEVEKAGAYEYKTGLTLVKVLALGGGMGKDARKNNVVVIRRIASDHIIGIEVDINDVLKGNRYDLDLAIKPYDIVMVPKSRIASVADFSNQMLDILSAPANIYLKGWQVVNVKTTYDFYKRVGGTP
ncbi:MAG: polysaccharide export protein [Candidatus Krumholzibacteriota bacterium]|nr:polysaccharide export protein [Candidatus Krumholzibacteriota bacterium]